MLAALLALAAGCSSETPQRAADVLPTVTVDHVRREVMTGGLSASGRLVSREEIAIAPELSGYRVATVLVEEDALVKRGQTLATLDEGLLLPQITQQRAAVAEREVAADKAEAEAERVKGLDNMGVLSQEAIEQRRLAVRTAAADLAVARAQLEELLVRQRRLVIRSPRAGRILERMVRPGDTSAAGTPMFLLARDDLVELSAEVLEAALQDVKVGDPVQVELASGARLDGTVRLIDPQVDTRTSLVNVRIALPRRRELRPGGYARAIFSDASADVSAVPESAIQFDADGASVLVLDDKQRVHRMNVRTGRRSNGRVELLSGPRPGATVVLSGGSFLLEGDRVAVEKAPRP